MLNFGPKLNVKDSAGETPIVVAVRKGNLSLVQKLFNRDARLDVLTVRGDSLLHIAARNNHWNIIKWLLDHGLDPSIENLLKQKPRELTTQKKIRDMLPDKVVIRSFNPYEYEEEEAEQADDGALKTVTPHEKEDSPKNPATLSKLNGPKRGFSKKMHVESKQSVGLQDTTPLKARALTPSKPNKNRSLDQSVMGHSRDAKHRSLTPNRGGEAYDSQRESIYSNKRGEQVVLPDIRWKEDASHQDDQRRTISQLTEQNQGRSSRHIRGYSDNEAEEDDVANRSYYSQLGARRSGYDSNSIGRQSGYSNYSQGLDGTQTSFVSRNSGFRSKKRNDEQYLQADPESQDTPGKKGKQRANRGAGNHNTRRGRASDEESMASYL